MKHNFLTTATFVLLAAMFSTQSNAMDIQSKGVKVGLNMGSASGADADPAGIDKSSRMGMAVGGFITMDLGNNLMLRPEFMYVQKGVVYDNAGTEQATNLAYLDIPVMLEYGVMQGNMPVNVFGGVNIGILLSAEAEVTGSGTTDIKADTTALDYGLQFGIGTVINKMITVDARYAMGLAKIDSAGSVDMKNSGIMITGGYMF